MHRGGSSLIRKQMVTPTHAVSKVDMVAPKEYVTKHLISNYTESTLVLGYPNYFTEKLRLCGLAEQLPASTVLRPGFDCVYLGLKDLSALCVSCCVKDNKTRSRIACAR